MDRVTNILITAEPRVGKSTALNNFLASYKGSITGLITTEIRNNSERVGFRMGTYEQANSLDIMGSIIAHVDFHSGISVSKYGIKVSQINMECKKMLTQRFKPETLLYLDEIGRMQLHSEMFKKLAQRCLDAPNICIATLSAVYNDEFTDEIRNRNDIVIIELTRETYEKDVEFIKELVRKISKAKKHTLAP